MSDWELALLFAAVASLAVWLIQRIARTFYSRVLRTRRARRHATQQAVDDLAKLLTPEGTEALQQFTRELVEDFDAALSAANLKR